MRIDGEGFPCLERRNPRVANLANCNAKVGGYDAVFDAKLHLNWRKDSNRENHRHHR